MNPENVRTGTPVDPLVMRFFPDASVRVVPAGKEQRFQIICTQGSSRRHLTSHLHLSEESAWKQARANASCLFRELLAKESNRGRVQAKVGK